jgi:hypothetical protein
MAVACVLPMLSGCVPSPKFVVGVTTDRQGRLALIVEAREDGPSRATMVTIWLRDGGGAAYPHTSATSATDDAGRLVTPPVDLVTVLAGPIRAGGPTVVPFSEPSATGWKAEPAITGLAPHRRYTVSRDRMTELGFDTGWFTEEPLSRPGAITDGTNSLDGKASRVIDKSWPQYVDDICG